LRFGVLLPPIDETSHHDLWVQALQEHLDQPRPFLARSEADAAIRRFDLAATGPLWEEMLAEAITIQRRRRP
jgi:hypothetical protein